MAAESFDTDCVNFQHVQDICNWCFVSSFAAIVYMYFVVQKKGLHEQHTS